MSKPDEATRLRRQMHEQRVTLRSQTRQLDRLRGELLPRIDRDA